MEEIDQGTEFKWGMQISECYWQNKNVEFVLPVFPCTTPRHTTGQ